MGSHGKVSRTFHSRALVRRMNLQCRWCGMVLPFPLLRCWVLSPLMRCWVLSPASPCHPDLLATDMLDQSGVGRLLGTSDAEVNPLVRWAWTVRVKPLVR